MKYLIPPEPATCFLILYHDATAKLKEHSFTTLRGFEDNFINIAKTSTMELSKWNEKSLYLKFDAVQKIGGIFLKRMVIMMWSILICGTICPFGVDAEEPAAVLEAKQAEATALSVDLSLQAAKLELEVAQKDWETAKRIFSVGGYYNYQSDNASIPSQGISLNSGGTFDAASSKWSLSFAPFDSANNTTITDVYRLTYYPFNLNYEKSVKTVELNLASKYLAYENTRVKLIADVRNAYAEAVQKEELHELAIQNLALVKDQLKKSNALYEAGKIPRLDVMDSEQQVKAAEAKLVTAGLNREAGFRKLSILLNNECITGVGLQRESLAWALTETVDLEATIARCLKNSPELKTASLNVELAKLQDLTDSFYLLKNISVGAGVYKNPGGGDTSYYSVGFRGALDDQYFRDKKGSRQKLEAAEFNLKVAILNKETQIREAYRYWRTMEISLPPMQESLNVAKERYRIALLKYENGRASESDVNQANLLLTQAQENYWNHWLALQQAREAFFQAASGNPVLTRNENN